MINQEQMDNNWTELMSIIDKYFEGEQKENILKLHSDFEDEYKTAPASGRPNYHNCFKGGYLDHVLHVIKNSLMIKNQYYEWKFFRKNEVSFRACKRRRFKVRTR